MSRFQVQLKKKEFVQLLKEGLLFAWWQVMVPVLSIKSDSQISLMGSELSSEGQTSPKRISASIVCSLGFEEF